MRFVQLTTRDDIAQHLRRRGAVTLFYADWCPFSVQMHNVAELAATKFPLLLWAKVPTDVADLPVRIGRIPTLVLTGADPETPIVQEGYLSASKLEALLREFAATDVVVEQTTCELVVDIRGWLDSTNARSKVKLSGGRGGTSIELTLGRNETQILIFFHHARDEELNDVARSDGLTKKGRKLLDKLRREKRIGSTALQGADDSADNRYLAKLISRVNGRFGKSKVIEIDSSSGYRLAPSIRTVIVRNGD